MLITELKSKEALQSAIVGKVFVLVCHGCKEVRFPEKEAEELIAQLGDACVGTMTTDYICNEENLMRRTNAAAAQIQAADTVLVLSCGVGVQTTAKLIPTKRIVAGCDTYPLPGWQGVTPQNVDCGQCGQCYLNLTGGICPITACSKSLINGQCGGAKNGKCEVDPTMDCGWERIQRKLTQIGRLDALKAPIQLRDYNK